MSNTNPTLESPNANKQVANRQVYSWLADRQTPAQLFEQLSASCDMAFLLESSDGDKRLARFSLLGSQPRLTALLNDGQWDITDTETQEITTHQAETGSSVLSILKELQETHLPAQDFNVEIPFSGGWVGYWGYGSTQYFENIPKQGTNPLGMPDIHIGLYDTVIVFDHLYRQLHLIGDPNSKRFESIKKSLEASQFSLPVLKAPKSQTLGIEDAFKDVTASMAKEAYCSKVLQAKQWITEGQVFQIVLAQRFSLNYSLSPFDAYRLLQALNPSPYAYYLKFPNAVYFGASPETCMSYQKGTVTLRALAGTRHRGNTAEEDASLATELRANVKEMAEHKMLVDLARNDLGKVSIPGTVQPGTIAEVVYYTHVMHLSTEVNGLLQPGKTAYDIVPACFPRGTVSGAPKVRAMQLLHQLEPEQRGVYSGMVGYIDAAGNLDAAIAIRSALIKDNVAHVQAGAGIVFDSDPEFEYEETRNKARSVLTALQLAKQLHT